MKAFQLASLFDWIAPKGLVQDSEFIIDFRFH